MRRGSAEAAELSLDPEGVEEGSEVEGILEAGQRGGFLWIKTGGQRHAIVRIGGMVDGGQRTGSRMRGRLSVRGGRWSLEEGVAAEPSGTNFDDLTSISPHSRIRLETAPDRHTTRVIDLVAPVGKGQRGLIVSAPRTGKTTLLRHIGEAVTLNHPEIHLIALLVDERPEEVTDLGRGLPHAELFASSIDSDPSLHTRISVLAIERAKRLVEQGRDVVVLADSLTRIGRAFNNQFAGGGRTMSGGLDSRALEVPRRLFGAARNTEEGGSLTVLATALVDTGSRMDELIFQEFKGTGNMELVLSRDMAEKRIWPAADIFLSGTRKEELIVGHWEMAMTCSIRRALAGMKPCEATARLVGMVGGHGSNERLLRELESRGAGRRDGQGACVATPERGRGKMPPSG